MTDDDDPPSVEDFTFGDPTESEDRGYINDLDPEELDSDTEIILATLRRAGDPVGTGAIRRETEQEQNKPVLDRLNRLSRAGMVRVTHTETLPGAAADRQYWDLTDDGEEWVDQHTLSATPTTADLLDDTLQRVLDRMDDMEETFEDIDTRLRGWQDTMDRRARRLDSIAETASEARKHQKQRIEDIDILWRRVMETHDESIEELQNELESLVEEQERLREEIKSERRERRNRNNDWNDWSGTVESRMERLEGRVSEAEKAAQQAEEKAERGLLDRLLPGR